MEGHSLTRRQSPKLNLPTVTLVAVSSVKLRATHRALVRSLRRANYAKVLLISHARPRLLNKKIKFVKVKQIDSLDAYSHFVLYKLHEYIDNDYVLIVQHDGYVLHPELWNPEFLDFDYLGAPWAKQTHTLSDGREITVGNGGFSLRSHKLLRIMNELGLPFTDNGTGFFNEDGVLCVYHREPLEAAGIVFAPENLAAQFSREPRGTCGQDRAFGFHGRVNRRSFMMDTSIRIYSLLRERR